MPDSDILFCSSCQAYFKVGEGGLRSTDCPRCGRSSAPRAGSEQNQPPPEVNPYASPTASLAQSDDLAPDTEVPPGFWGKFAEAFHLLFANLGLFSLLVLTVWLPGNLVVRLVAMNSPAADTSIRLNNIIQGIFGPIYIGGLMHAAFDNAGWASARVVSRGGSLTVGLGSLGAALVGSRADRDFDPPRLHQQRSCGIILSIRYSLIEPIVVLESVGASDAMGRSATLSKTRSVGRSWVRCFCIWSYTSA